MKISLLKKENNELQRHLNRSIEENKENKYKISDLENRLQKYLHLEKEYKILNDTLDNNNSAQKEQIDIINNLSKKIIDLENLIKEKNEELNYINNQLNEKEIIPENIIDFLNRVIVYIKGGNNYDNKENLLIDKSNKIEISEIEKILPLIENFIVKIGNDYMDLEDKFIFLENTCKTLKNSLLQENVKLKKTNEENHDLKEEIKVLKDQLNNLLIGNEIKKTKKVKKNKKKGKASTLTTIDSEDKKVKNEENIRHTQREISQNRAIDTNNNMSKIKTTKNSEKNIYKIKVKNEEFDNEKVTPNNNINNNLSSNQIDFEGHSKILHNQQSNFSCFSIEDNNIIHVKNFENLKQKIKDLENKIYEINNDEKEKNIIESLRNFRHNINVNHK